MKIIYYKIRAVLVTLLLRMLPRNPPIIFKGADSSIALCEQLAVLGYQKALLVTDNFLHTSGLLNGITEKLDSLGVAYAIYDGVLPDPAFDQVQAGEKLLTNERCDCVVAVGGGSVIDAAKMISMLHTNPGDLNSFDGIQPCKYPGLVLFAVPTTAGTGAEITGVAVVTDPATHNKIPVPDTKMIPGYIALDAKIMQGMPPSITAATGMDALTHAVESYLSKASNAQTEVHAKTAVKLIFEHLPTAFNQGDNLIARDAMAMAAFYAGSAFGKTSVGYVHGIAHQLGRVCGTPHGNANAMVLPEVLAAYGACVQPKLAALAKLVGLGSDTDSDAVRAKQFISSIIDLRASMNMPLQPQGLQRSAIPEIVTAALAEAGSLYPVPRYMARAEVRAIVEPLLAG
nr:putative iron-containing alcohol dehydrogenase [uncultured bacterium]